jgi:hypothetical protein
VAIQEEKYKGGYAVANETERLQLEFGRNDRWQAKAGKSYSSPFPTARYAKMASKGVRRRSHVSAQDRKRLAILRKRLDPSNY